MRFGSEERFGDLRAAQVGALVAIELDRMSKTKSQYRRVCLEDFFWRISEVGCERDEKHRLRELRSPLVTRGGLLVIGATVFDNKFRIFDKVTGKLLWEKVLPFAANATPMTYEIKGKQYVVVACGGEGRNPKASKGGSIFYAFALPQ